MFKRHLTLIFKVDFFSLHTRMRRERCKNAALGAARPPQLLTIDEAAMQQGKVC
jgi:hypothetical protein